MEDERHTIEQQRIREQWFNLQKQKFDSFVQQRKRQKQESKPQVAVSFLNKCHFGDCGCTEGNTDEADIKKCDTCKLVAYCSIQHESQDMKRHARTGCQFARKQYLTHMKQAVSDWLRNLSMIELDMNAKALLSSQPLFSTSQLEQFRSCIPIVASQLQTVWTSNLSRCALLVYCFLASDTICFQVARLRNFSFPVGRQPVVEKCDVTTLGVPAFVLTTGLNLFAAPQETSVGDFSPPECYKMSDVTEEGIESSWSLLFSAFLCTFVA